MKEQETAEKQELETNVQAAEESQAPETTDDVVVEEDKSVTEEVTPSKEVEEEKPLEEVSEPEPKKEEKIPFTERPGVKERLEDIEQKYGSKAQYWDSLTELAQQDPGFRVAVLEKLEAAGKVPDGTTEAERQRASSLKEESEYVEKLPDDIKADLMAAREYRRQQESKATEFLSKFESNKSDIAASPNPQRTRSLIFNLATEMVQREKVPMADAMERAYKVLLHGGVSDQEVETAIAKNQEGVGAVSSGGVSASKGLRKLTQEEKRAAELAGMTPREYVKFKDTPDDELFENI